MILNSPNIFCAKLVINPQNNKKTTIILTIYISLFYVIKLYPQISNKTPICSIETIPGILNKIKTISKKLREQYFQKIKNDLPMQRRSFKKSLRTTIFLFYPERL